MGVDEFQAMNIQDAIVPALDLELTSPRLVLRRWTVEDGALFNRLHADREVMHDLEAPLTAVESAGKFGRYRQTFEEYGFGRWAVTLRDTGEVMGYTGVQPIRGDLPVAPGFEIGWRLFRHTWGQGFATEAARLALEDVFTRCGLDEVLSFTGVANKRSEAVMLRVGMQRCRERDFVDPDNFHGLCVVYRATPTSTLKA